MRSFVERLDRAIAISFALNAAIALAVVLTSPEKLTWEGIFATPLVVAICVIIASPLVVLEAPIIAFVWGFAAKIAGQNPPELNTL